MRQQVLQSDRFRAENDDCDSPPGQILLVLQAAVYRQQNTEMGRLGGVQKVAVLEAGETSVLRRLTFVPTKVISQSLIHTLVEQNPHS